MDEKRDVLAPELMARVSQIQIRTFRLVNDVLSGAYRSTFRGTGVEFDWDMLAPFEKAF